MRHPAEGEWLPRGFELGGRYAIEEPLGAGGFGHVYRAVQRPLDRQVAIKLLPRAVLASPEHVERFRREAVLVQRLEHPNTVRLLDFGVAEDGAPFIVMELLRGESLASVIERGGPLGDGRTARVASHVLKSLMEAHELGIVHRDIKPANVFITSHAGEPFFAKLLDFGIAKEVHPAAGAPLSLRGIAAADAALTHASQVMGTPRYMSPEQVAGGPVGPAADLYALGLSLAECLAGRPVFDSENSMEICQAHLSADPVPLPPLVAESKLRAIIERATRKRASERHASAAAMLAEVEALGVGAAADISGSIRIDRDRIADVAALDATLPTPMKGVGAFEPTEAMPATGEPQAHVPPAARKRLVLIGIAAALGVVAMASWFGLRGTPPAPQTASSAASHEGVSALPEPGPVDDTSSEVASSDASADHSPIGVLNNVPPFPEGDWSTHSPKRKLLAFDSTWLKRRLPALGWTLTSVAESSTAIVESLTLGVAKNRCVGPLQYYAFKNEKDAAQAVALARRYEKFAFVIDGTRVLTLAISAHEVNDARTCTMELFNALTKP